MIRGHPRLLLPLFFALVLLSVESAAAARRIALVIGNDAYQQLPALQKAVADATDFAAVLKKKGFEKVFLHKNLTRLEMDLAVGEFIDSIAENDTAVFFYSGHGWASAGQNYLVGIDVPKVAAEGSLTRISIPLQNGSNGIIDEMANRRATLKVAIVDACRDNPFQSNVAGRGVGQGRGLARIADPPSGTFIVFSAGAGQTALDQLGDDDTNPNSVFSRIFLPHVAADLPLLEAVKATQTEVEKIALSMSPRHQQNPAYYDQVSGSACLSELCRSGSAPPLPLPEGREVAAVDPSTGEDITFWMAIEGSINPADFKEFLKSFPQSQLTPVAHIRLARIESQFWESIATSNRVSDLEAYLEYYPIGTHASEASTRLAALQEAQQEVQQADELWQRVQGSDNIAELQDYVDKHPAAEQADQARQRIARLRAVEGETNLWNGVAASPDRAGIESYLETHPDGLFVDDAKQLLASVRALEQETDRWNGIEKSSNPADFDAFLLDYPSGAFATQAQARRAVLRAEDEQAWTRIATSEDPADFDDYLSKFPYGAHLPEAETRLKALRPPELSGRELNVALQEVLKRVGCYSGRVDGDWGRRSQSALEAMIRQGAIDAESRPSAELLKQIQSLETRVCVAVVAPPRAEPRRQPPRRAVVAPPRAEPRRPPPRRAAPPKKRRTPAPAAARQRPPPSAPPPSAPPPSPSPPRSNGGTTILP